MLATPFTPGYSTAHAFLPAIPSPLSPRSAALHGPRSCGRGSYDGSMSPASSPTAPRGIGGSGIGQESAGAGNVPFSRRAIRTNPSPRPDELRERRRGAFLRRVQEGRDDKRFESRGEDIMRMDFFRRRRAWEAEQAILASDLSSGIEEEMGEGVDVPARSGDAMQMTQAEEAEEAWRRENEELQALIADMPPDTGGEAMHGRSEHFGSDDDDYDAFFSEIMDSYMGDTAADSATQQRSQEQSPAEPVDESEAMDES